MAITPQREPEAPRGGGWRELFRYAASGKDDFGNEVGVFESADGTPSVAFVGLTRDGWPYAFGSRLDTSFRGPFSQAISFGSRKYGCCNGRRFV